MLTILAKTNKTRNMTHIKFIELGIVIFILISILILLSATVIESLHSNDKGWVKPKYVYTLESIGAGIVISAFTGGIIYCLIFALINR